MAGVGYWTTLALVPCCNVIAMLQPSANDARNDILSVWLVILCWRSTYQQECGMNMERATTTAGGGNLPALYHAPNWTILSSRS
jgi:hypothetical protein